MGDLAEGILPGGYDAWGQRTVVGQQARFSGLPCVALAGGQPFWHVNPAARCCC